MEVYRYPGNSSTYPSPVEGNCYFLANESSALTQDVDVYQYSTLIDSGQASYNMSLYHGCNQAYPKDEAVMHLGFLEQRYIPFDLSEPGETRKPSYVFKSTLL